MLKNVKCARCVRCGKEYEAVPNLTNCSCGGILDIVYDYDYIKAHLTKETLKNRVNPTMWRYRELLPVEETTPDTPLRVGWSPLYEEPKLAEQLGLGRLWVKDDGINPTASLKDRASAMAVAKAHEAGAKIIACSSTGNAASSLAGNAAAAGFKTYIFVPERAHLRRRRLHDRGRVEGPEGPVRHRLHRQAAAAHLRPVHRLLPHQPRHPGEQALGADGGEHHRRLHLRRRAAQRR